MPAYRGPLEMPVGAIEISRAVQEFAKQHDLDSHLWYHDEPLWLIEKNDGNEICRQVQVAAFQTEDDESLYFIPHAYGIVNSDFCTTRPDKTEKSTVKLPLSYLYKSVAIGHEENLVDNIKFKLHEAWQAATILSKHDLLENLSSKTTNNLDPS